MITEDFCTFCKQEEDKIYIKTDNFTVWLAVGQIVEGYSLIIPNNHYHCIGALPQSLQSEYLELKELVRKKLEEEYGGCIFYEHGRVGVCNVQPGEQLCYHGHTHAIPTNVDIIESFKDDGIIPIKLQEDKELFEKYYDYGHYLFYENNKRESYIIPINQPIRRQYLRFLLASKLGRPELAEWSKYPEWDKFHCAKEKLGRKDG
ncbi:MAG: HIT domain-containing protein [Bacillota bacterium]|jgi:diadenosine tetraphosphate (Ap4A) HIT family hydrolase|uniref:HIT domain-containing protein n=1 Tax=Streptococcus sp. TaxID=1306 RepID=UPI00179E7374|nr:HIT domain-containing protein [Streptococcus sp.]MDI9541084.1 HIT domain-containing protein [Bacillota bacterium]HHU65182.1 HIT domain-containing protein [Streptococcus sp.]